MGRSAGTLLTIFEALPLVTMTSQRAFTAALQLMYATTYRSGCAALMAASFSAGQESASEQPASISGRSTRLVGFTILAVSAMKCTPQKTIVAFFASAALYARPSESPT